MGKDTIANIITSIRNADMNRKGMVQIPAINITENIFKILLREGFIENVSETLGKQQGFLGFNPTRSSTTSRGIMTDREARLQGIGGEILCFIW